MQITAHGIAQRFLGLQEVRGQRHNPFIVAMLKQSAGWIEDDETAWCGAFVNHICWLLDLPAPKGAAALTARQWLTVGEKIDLMNAKPGFDVVILKRGKAPQPGPDVTKGAPGHVGFFSGIFNGYVRILGGNQSNAVTIQEFRPQDVLGVRRLRREQ